MSPQLRTYIMMMVCWGCVALFGRLWLRCVRRGTITYRMGVYKRATAPFNFWFLVVSLAAAILVMAGCGLIVSIEYAMGHFQ
jgi:hypothetical protein